MLKFLKKIFPSKNEKDVKELLPIVDEINSYYEQYQSLSDDELKAKTPEFKQRIKDRTSEIENKITELQEKLKTDISHEERVDAYDEVSDLNKELYETISEVLDEILPEAFAVVKDTCRRLVGKPWDAAGTKINWNMIPYDVQIIGGMVLHSGRIARWVTVKVKL